MRNPGLRPSPRRLDPLLRRDRTCHGSSGCRWSSPSSMAAETPRPENAPIPSFLKSQPLVTPDFSAQSFTQKQPQPKWMDSDPDCEAACFDQWNQCCTYGGCEQCSCQLALCRAGCGDPWYGC